MKEGWNRTDHLFSPASSQNVVSTPPTASSVCKGQPVHGGKEMGKGEEILFTWLGRPTLLEPVARIPCAHPNKALYRKNDLSGCTRIDDHRIRRDLVVLKTTDNDLCNRLNQTDRGHSRHSRESGNPCPRNRLRSAHMYQIIIAPAKLPMQSLPPEVYLRGYLTQYAQILRLDAGRVTGGYLQHYHRWKDQNR